MEAKRKKELARMSSILVIGGTGNMGRPLVRSMVECGHSVSVVCRRKVVECDTKRLADGGGGYFYGDAKDRSFMGDVLKRHYDAVVDFCIYTSDEFRERMGAFLDSTDQYVALSTAAVYADTPAPKNESSPRYIEVDPPQEGTEKWYWYCYEKARIEDMLFNSGRRNWTIVRPGVTMNANHIGWGNWWNDNWCGRIIRGRRVAVEEDMLDYKSSLSSGAQVASLIGGVVGNQKAKGEVFNVCSQEVWSWRELLDAYKRIFAKNGYELKVRYINSQDVIGTDSTREYWYKRARLLDRVFDNAKIRSVISSPLLEYRMEDLLEKWTEAYIANYERPIVSNRGQLRQVVEMDKLAGDHSPWRDFSSLRLYLKYLVRRYRPRSKR